MESQQPPFQQPLPTPAVPPQQMQRPPLIEPPQQPRPPAVYGPSSTPLVPPGPPNLLPPSTQATSLMSQATPTQYPGSAPPLGQSNPSSQVGHGTGSGGCGCVCMGWCERDACSRDSNRLQFFTPRPFSSLSLLWWAVATASFLEGVVGMVVGGSLESGTLPCPNPTPPFPHQPRVPQFLL